jgi:pimeloyl-ACP methyl ester carboxylesterase
MALLVALCAACSSDAKGAERSTVAPAPRPSAPVTTSAGAVTTDQNGTTTASPPASATEAPTTAATTAPPSTTAPATTAAPTTTVAPPAPVFVAMPCDPEPSVPERVTCGMIQVAERHAEPDGRMISIAVAIVSPRTPPADDVPVVFLAGGPGFGSVDSVEQMLTDAPFERTIVLVDYRGVGRSHPSLYCHEDDPLSLAGLSVTADDEIYRDQSRAALQECHDRLVDSGVDLAAYNYEEIAADLDDLRRALHHEVWDLWGLSNGGRVALEVVRRHPDGVRALVLDAPSPPQANLLGDLWSNAAAAFDHLFARCAGDPVCDAAFPDLAGTYARLVAMLRDAPIEVVVPATEDWPETTVLYTDTLALGALRQALYETDLIPLLPFFITELANGRGYDVVAQLIVERTLPSPAYSDGMAMTVNCREEISFLEPDHFEEQAEELPLLAAAISTEAGLFDGCELWDVGEADHSFDEPVASGVPALILVGEFDPVHPASDARAIADGLPNATVVELPGLGHGTLFTSECAATLAAVFLQDPAAPIGTACVDAVGDVEWLLPAPVG